MTAENFDTFQKFNDPDLAEAIAQQLRAKGIDSQVEKFQQQRITELVRPDGKRILIISAIVFVLSLLYSLYERLAFFSGPF